MVLAIGLVLALSLTVIVLQTFKEMATGESRGRLQRVFSPSFSGYAVIPMLAFIPLLAIPQLLALNTAANDGHDSLFPAAHLPNWLHAVVIIGAIASVAIVGRFLTKPLFKYVAKSDLREVLAATPLMLVIDIAALISMVGLSSLFGAFIACK